jgi:WD40 repeat protein
VAAGGSDNLDRIWSLSQGRQTAELVGHTGSVAALAWDSATSTLASGSYDTTVRLWSLKTSGLPDHTARGPGGPDPTR